MKSNGHMDHSWTPGLINSTDVYASWALYLSMFVTQYEANGIPIWGMTPQNEPESNQQWESCVYSPEDERDFIRDYLGPQLSQDHPDLNLLIYDHNKNDILNWVNTIMSDPEAAQYVVGTAFHWYSGSQFENVQQAHQNYPDKFLLATEACNCPASADDWGYAANYAWDILGDLNNWAVGWIDWNLILDQYGGPDHISGESCNAAILVDTQNQIVTLQPTYYYYGQISRYVVPGSYRITANYYENVEASGFLTPDGNVVLVVFNPQSYGVEVQIVDGDNFAIFSMPASSIATFIYDSSMTVVDRFDEPLYQ